MPCIFYYYYHHHHNLSSNRIFVLMSCCPRDNIFHQLICTSEKPKIFTYQKDTVNYPSENLLPNFQIYKFCWLQMSKYIWAISWLLWSDAFCFHHINTWINKFIELELSKPLLINHIDSNFFFYGWLTSIWLSWDSIWYQYLYNFSATGRTWHKVNF